LQIQLILSAPTYDPVMQLRSIDIDNVVMRECVDDAGVQSIFSQTSVTTTISKTDALQFVVNEYKTATLFQVMLAVGV
jgi:hypothetical protein